MAVKTVSGRRRADSESTAFHEAGHAVVAFFSTDLQVDLVTIAGEDGPHCYVKPLSPEEIERVGAVQVGFQLLTMGFAGPAAQWRIAPPIGDNRDNNYTDFDKAPEVVSEFIGEFAPDDLDRFLVNRFRDAENAVIDHWPQIEAVATALLREKTLDRHRLREVILATTPH